MGKSRFQLETNSLNVFVLTSIFAYFCQKNCIIFCNWISVFNQRLGATHSKCWVIVPIYHYKSTPTSDIWRNKLLKLILAYLTPSILVFASRFISRTNNTREFCDSDLPLFKIQALSICLANKFWDETPICRYLIWNNNYPALFRRLFD